MKKTKIFIFVLLMFHNKNVLSLTLVDFDNVKRRYAQFKDDKGSLIYFSPFVYEKGQGNVLKFQYDIVKGGWGGWICFLDGVDASKYEFLSFKVKGEKGQEKFEIGIKDTSGIEKKIQIENYAKLTTEWQKVSIPLSEFSNVNLSSLENISFAANETHGKGTVYIDDIDLEGEREKIKEEIPVRKEVKSRRLTKVLIDGFERTNPYDFYKVWTQDNSLLKLASSRLLYEGDYSMEMEYILDTDKPLGTWVSARYDIPRPFDWSNVKTLKIYLKGDGTDNIFRIQIVDKDGEVWYNEDINAMKSTKWQQIKFDISDFKLYRKTGNGKFDLDEILSYDLMVLSRYSGKYQGKIYVDQFVAEGIEITPEEVSLPGIVEKLRVAIPTVGNIYFTGILYNEYLNAPEEGRRILHWGKITADGKIDMFSARIEFASYGQSFGEASSIAYDYFNRVYTVTQSPSIIVPNIQLMVNNLSAFLSNITLGNIWASYSKYVFSMPGWGFKGLTAEGDIGRYNYHLFYLSQPYDSYSLGMRIIRYLPTNTKLVLYGIYSYETAKSVGTTSKIKEDELSYTSSWDIKPVSEDKVYNLELWQWFLSRKLQLQCIVGANQYSKYATADYTDAYHPVYNQELEQTQEYWGTMYYGRLELNNLYINGLNLSYTYRVIDTEYKPKFRDSPAWFDDYDGDQKGYNVRFSYFWQGFSISSEYDDIIRLSNSNYFRRKASGSIGYYGFRGLDISYYYEHRYEKYIYTSSRTGFSIYKPKEELDIHEIYIRNQLTDKIACWFKVRKEFIRHLETSTDSLFAKLEYFLSPNARLFAEHKITRYPESSWEPIGWPFDDNYTKVSFELWF